MSTTSYLSGKIHKHSLPAYEKAPGSDAPTVKRLLLPHGELAQFYDSDAPLHYLAFIELRPGTVRGNHFHRVKEEGIYVLHGQFLLVLQDIETQARTELPMATGDSVLIPPGIAHTLSISEPGAAVEFSKNRFDPKDVYRHVLVSSPPPRPPAPRD